MGNLARATSCIATSSIDHFFSGSYNPDASAVVTSNGIDGSPANAPNSTFGLDKLAALESQMSSHVPRHHSGNIKGNIAPAADAVSRSLSYTQGGLSRMVGANASHKQQPPAAAAAAAAGTLSSCQEDVVMEEELSANKGACVCMCERELWIGWTDTRGEEPTGSRSMMYASCVIAADSAAAIKKCNAIISDSQQFFQAEARVQAHYRLMEIMGKGAYGIVWKVCQ